MSDHSVIAPSSASIWGKPGGCTGFPYMAMAYPQETEGEEAAEGTATHELAEQIIRGHTKALDIRVDNIKAASNGVVITEDMRDAARLYADDVAAVMQSARVFGGNGFGLEHYVEAKRIHDLLWGRLDCFLWDEVNAHLYVWDFKNGHLPVEAFENRQAMCYVAGLFDEFDFGVPYDENLTVHIRIVQPRAFHREGPIREWVVMGSDLRPYFDELRTGAAESLGPNKTCRSGAHCRYCSGRHACDTALKAGVQLYEAAAAPAPVELSVEAVAVQYGIVQRARKQLEYLETGYEEQIQGLVRGGVNVPGWMVEPGVGRECWSKPAHEVAALGELYGVDVEKKDLITPNQAKKKGIPEDVVKMYSEIPHRGMKLIADDGTIARKTFSRKGV